MTVAEAGHFIAEGHFAPGSMLPKIEACVQFVTNRRSRGPDYLSRSAPGRLDGPHRHPARPLGQLKIMQNIVLIGMPGAGKSTVGVILAKFLSKDFVDTDLLIQNRHRQSLQAILAGQGYLKLREFEESEILQLNVKNAVIATGGSAVLQRTGHQAFEKTWDHRLFEIGDK